MEADKNKFKDSLDEGLDKAKDVMDKVTEKSVRTGR